MYVTICLERFVIWHYGATDECVRLHSIKVLVISQPTCLLMYIFDEFTMCVFMDIWQSTFCTLTISPSMINVWKKDMIIKYNYPVMPTVLWNNDSTRRTMFIVQLENGRIAKCFFFILLFDQCFIKCACCIVCNRNMCKCWCHHQTRTVIIGT
jgi:hypothetical protein